MNVDVKKSKIKADIKEIGIAIEKVEKQIDDLVLKLVRIFDLTVKVSEQLELSQSDEELLKCLLSSMEQQLKRMQSHE